MSNIQTDSDAWFEYPHHRRFFNKLELALRLGYNAGPCGVSVNKPDYYIVRPIYNLSGMGVSARRVYLHPGDLSTVKPGEFWCEYFHGPNVTIDYEWQTLIGEPILKPVFAAVGYRNNDDFYRFARWCQIDPPMPILPKWISELQDVPRFNIEFIHENIIEIHLRPGVDFPPDSKQIIPVWDDTNDTEIQRYLKIGFKYISSPDDADGHLRIGRQGFLYK